MVELEVPNRDGRNFSSEMPFGTASPRIREDDNPEVLQVRLRKLKEDREWLERTEDLRRVEEDLERALSGPLV
jgi:hypothetical protein